MLEKNTFSQASVADAMKDMISIHLEAGQGESSELSKKFNIHAYPTLVVVDPNGEEIDRFIGYRPPEPFKKEIARILAGENTIQSLRQKVAKTPDDVDAAVALGAKLASARPDEVTKYFDDLGAKVKAKDKPTQARVLLERAAALLEAQKTEDAAKAAETLVKDYADTPSAGMAAARAGRAFTSGDPVRALAFLEAARKIAKTPQEKYGVERFAISLHHHGEMEAMKRQGAAAFDDAGWKSPEEQAQALNEVSWHCFETRMVFPETLAWVQKAVEKSKRDPAILDTLANILWLFGQRDEAMKLEEEALGKAEDPGLKRELAGNIAKWKAESGK
jgi:tetratricopeptide (TPR) repeat protein